MKNKKDVKKKKIIFFFVQHKHKESKKNILEIYINNMQCFLIYYLGGGVANMTRFYLEQF